MKKKLKKKLRESRRKAKKKLKKSKKKGQNTPTPQQHESQPKEQTNSLGRHKQRSKLARGKFRI